MTALLYSHPASTLVPSLGHFSLLEGNKPSWGEKYLKEETSLMLPPNKAKDVTLFKGDTLQDNNALLAKKENFLSCFLFEIHFQVAATSKEYALRRNKFMPST